MEGGKQNSLPSQEEENSNTSDEISFVLAEEVDSMAASNVMTRSKYAQVVFPEVADRYPNDCDILCKFTYNLGVPTATASTSDRIGLYRVPNFASHEYISFHWVADATKHGKDGFSVVFKSSVLPKDEDFYQFQYLRTDNGVEAAIGASVPFQLQGPISEDLCTVEDDEEFMVVRSKTSFVSEQLVGQLDCLTVDNSSLKEKLKDYELKHKKLVEMSEKMQSDLHQKSEKCQSLEAQIETMKKDQDKLEMLKVDLATVLQEKLAMEEKVHRQQKAIQTIQMDRDMTAGEKDQAIREKNLLMEERNQVMKKSEELHSLLNAALSAKEIAVSEVKSHIVKSDEMLKTITSLEAKIARLEALSKDLLEVNKELISAKEDAYAQVERLTARFKQNPNRNIEEVELLNKNLVEINHELIASKNAIIEQLRKKESECDALREEMAIKSKRKCQEIDDLKKHLNDAERNLKKIHSDFKETSCMTDNDSTADNTIEAKLEEIAKAVQETRNDMKEFICKSERSSVVTACTDSSRSSLTTTDSFRLMDPSMINSELELARRFQDFSDNKPESGSSWAPIEQNFGDLSAVPTSLSSPIKSKFNDVIEGFKELEDGPQNHGGARPRPRPRPKASNPAENSSLASLCQFLPQISASMFGPLNLGGFSETPEPINEQPKMADPLVPEVVGSKDSSADEAEFSELVSWAKGSVGTPMKKETASEPSIVITDDGRILTEDEIQQLKCPICDDKFEQDQVKALELHVDAHLASKLYCPVCQLPYEVTDRAEYKAHVQGHFANEDDDDDEPIRRTWSFMDFD